jgi:hypothetical protein
MSTGDFPWSAASGTNPWDVNDPTLFASGQVTATDHPCPQNNTQNGTVTVNFPMTAGAFVGYTLKKTGFPPPAYDASEISANTSNTITYKGGHDSSTCYDVGQHVEVRKVLQTIDQPGVGKGTMVTNGPGGTPTPPPGWTQAVDPCYAWNNTSISMGSTSSVIRAGVHFINGVKPGYTTFTYPHPLVSGGGPSPSPIPTATATSFPSVTPPLPIPTATVAPTATPTPVPPSPTSVPATPTPAPSVSPTRTPTPTPTATTPPSLPSAPSGLVANPGNPKRSITINWQNTGPADSIEIERGDNPNQFQQVTVVPSNVTEFTDRDLISSDRYFYRVRARNVIGVSEYSNVVNAQAK